jgi:hypothetical protein
VSSTSPVLYIPETAAPPRRLRTWPAVLVLFFLPGVTAEMLTGSTPVLVYLTNTISFVTNTLLYGSGAILIREVVRQRGLGWVSIMLLGVAYGIFEEGLVVNTWANPWLPQICNVVNGTATGLCDYSRVGGINLAWAASLTFFHAIISIAVPILLVDLLFPRRAPLPWLGRKAPFAFVGADILVLAFGVLFNVVSFRQHGRPGPYVGPYIAETALMAVFIVWALCSRPRVRGVNPRPAPRLWTLRAVGFLALLLGILLPGLFQGAKVPFQIELTVYGVLLALAWWRVARWARRTGWNERHMLALASGALGFFLLLWDPILEVAGVAGGNPTRGTALVALAYLILLILLARRAKRRLRALQEIPPAEWTAPTAPMPV